MKNMYLFKNENEIIAYDGSPLRFYVGKTLIKQIYAPSESELAEFGYKKLAEGPIPEYDEKKQYLSETYTDGEVITKVYEVRNLEEVYEETEEIIE